jgi:hypothetical protein
MMRNLDHATLETLRMCAARGARRKGESNPRLSREPWVLASGRCMAGWRATGAAVGVR